MTRKYCTQNQQKIAKTTHFATAECKQNVTLSSE